MTAVFYQQFIQNIFKFIDKKNARRFFFSPFYFTQLKISVKTTLKNNDTLYQKQFYLICCRDFSYFSLCLRKQDVICLDFIYFLNALKKQSGRLNDDLMQDGVGFQRSCIFKCEQGFFVFCTL